MVDASDLLKGLDDIDEKVRASLGLIGDTAAKQLANTAKSNAIWIDRTGDARRTIGHFSEWVDKDKLEIGIYGSMHYSPYLELSFDKRYAILYPTVLAESKNIATQLSRVLGVI